MCERNERYQKFYGQYIPEFGGVESQGAKSEYIEGRLYPFLSRLWDLFALSAIGGDGSGLGEYGDLYRAYSGTQHGARRYENAENRTFPTVAPHPDIERLVESYKMDDDVLYVAKFYYANTFPMLALAARKMLEMHDANGVPTDGWRQQYISFHGYSTRYEYGDNRETALSQPSKEFGSSDPYVYSKLQLYCYRVSMGETVSPSEFLAPGFQPAEAIPGIGEYLNSGDCVYRGLSGLSIRRLERDNFGNVFALLKGEGDTAGVILFRSAKMMLGVPLGRRGLFPHPERQPWRERAD